MCTRGVRTTCKSQSPLSIMLILGKKLSLSGLATKYFYPLTLLTCPCILIIQESNLALPLCRVVHANSPASKEAEAGGLLQI